MKWSIMAHAAPYQPGAKTCNLCLAENLPSSEWTQLQPDGFKTGAMRKFQRVREAFFVFGLWSKFVTNSLHNKLL